ncbi:MAG: 3-oxo-tetronate kinase [Rubricella sp.]
MKLGCIGDDFTGSSDLGNTLTKTGMRVVQLSGVPGGTAPEADAVVVALKSRTAPVERAVEESLAACDWLIGQGADLILFKICSTFDSTPRGNIGPVAEALAKRLGARHVLVCPAFPGAGRTVYQGHLFVGDRPLNESGMEHHPLTPMTDSDLRRVLAPQTAMPVEHVPWTTVARGAGAVLERLRASGGFAIADAIRDEDLVALGRAAIGERLVVGGSGIGIGLREAFDLPRRDGDDWSGRSAPVLALSGSCSEATRAQVAAHRAAGHPVREMTAEAALAGADADALADWALAADGVPLLYSSADPDTVRAAQTAHGAVRVSEALERMMAEIARAALTRGVQRLIVAGGETSGAVVEGLGLSGFRFGPEIAPGVPCLSALDRPLALALKSGNFGQEDFFARAASMLEGRA